MRRAQPAEARAPRWPVLRRQVAAIVLAVPLLRAPALLVGPSVALLALATSPARVEAAETVLDALKRGLKDSRPEARAAAVDLAGRGAGPLAADERRRLALALRKALEGDPEVTVRVAAVQALARLSDEAAWVRVLIAALTSKDDPVKEAAITAVLTARSDLVPIAGKLLHEDQDPTFRAETALILGRRRRLDAAPVLLEALLDPHPRVSTAAAEALEAISGEAFGYDAAAWGAWWERARPSAPPPTPGAKPGETITREAGPVVPPPPPPPPRGLVPDLYGLPLRAKDIVFCIDVSGSIGASGLETAKSSLVRAVERLGSDVRIAALFFDEAIREWHPEMVYATPTAKAELARFVRGIPRGHHTDVMTPLNAGLSIVRRRVEEKTAAKEKFLEPVTLIVVSDGQENVRATPGEFVGDKLDRLDLAHAVVHALVLGGKDNALMLALARRAGGTYVVVP